MSRAGALIPNNGPFWRMATKKVAAKGAAKKPVKKAAVKKPAQKAAAKKPVQAAPKRAAPARRGPDPRLAARAEHEHQDPRVGANGGHNVAGHDKQQHAGRPPAPRRDRIINWFRRGSGR